MKRAAMTRKKDDDIGIVPVSNVKKAKSFCFYGRSGTGKTTLFGTFPGKKLLIDVQDEGTDSVSDIKDMDVKEIEDFADFEDTYWWIKDHPKVYKNIAIDTVSMLQMIAVREISEKNKKPGKRAGDWGTMSQRAWGDVAALMKEWLINYRDLTRLGINVVFIAQDRTFNMNDEDDSDNAVIPEVGPALSPSIAKALNAAVSMVGNTFIRSRTIVKEVKGKKVKKEVTEYCLRVGPNPVYTTKVRKPRDIRAPDFIVDPDYETIMDIINGD